MYNYELDPASIVEDTESILFSNNQQHLKEEKG